MEIWIIIPIIVVALMIWYFAYYRKKLSEIKKTCNELLNDYHHIFEDYAELTAKVSVLNEDQKHLIEQNKHYQEQVENNKQLSEILQIEYNRKQEYIDSIDSLASDKKKQLEDQYIQEENKLKEQLRQYREQCDIDKENAQNEIKKIESTISSLVKAYALENQEKEKKNLNRLDIKDEDISDIKLLQSIRIKFSNPRVISKIIWQSYYQPEAKRKFSIILDNDTKTGIYKITNIIDNKSYIGQAVDIYKRWCDHCKCGCGIDTPANNKLYKAMLEDGLYNFRFELLEECPREQLNEKEKYYIDLYQSVTFGYNSQGGNGNCGQN